MPLQAVTLEPLVQGEHVVIVLRLLGRTEHAHRLWSATFCWYEISAQGTGPLANISEKFCLLLNSIIEFYALFKRRTLSSLFEQCTLNRLLQHTNTFFHIRGIITCFGFFLRQLITNI